MSIYSQKLVEGDPTPLPPVPGLSPQAAVLPADLIWLRIEGFTGRRFAFRDAEWFINGFGAYWQPTVEPWQIDGMAEWNTSSELWEPRDLPSWQPDRGYRLTGHGRWRFLGSIGSVDLPAMPFIEAYRRLAEYLAAGDAAAEHWVPGVRSYTVSDGGMSITQQRAANWQADAFRLSGAADALRYHRRPR